VTTAQRNNPSNASGRCSSGADHATTGMARSHLPRCRPVCPDVLRLYLLLHCCRGVADRGTTGRARKEEISALAGQGGGLFDTYYSRLYEVRVCRSTLLSLSSHALPLIPCSPSHTLLSLSYLALPHPMLSLSSHALPLIPCSPSHLMLSLSSHPMLSLSSHALPLIYL
jgi:hypothetical protein